MIGFAPKHINVAGGQVAFLFLVGKEWSHVWIADPATGLVLVQCSLKRAHKQIAFGPVIVNDPQPPIRAAVVADEGIAQVCDDHFLTIE